MIHKIKYLYKDLDYSIFFLSENEVPEEVKRKYFVKLRIVCHFVHGLDNICYAVHFL